VGWQKEQASYMSTIHQYQEDLTTKQEDPIPEGLSKKRFLSNR
jgi:hypothetical protein